MNFGRRALISLILAVPLAACEQSDVEITKQAGPKPTSENFAQALDKRTKAIVGRNLDRVTETITKGERLTMIFANGERISYRGDYLNFHREWFADKAWTIRLEKESVDVSGEYGWALYRVDYDPDGPAGPRAAQPSWQTLGFRWLDSEWRLVHQQSTPMFLGEAETVAADDGGEGDTSARASQSQSAQAGLVSE